MRLFFYLKDCVAQESPNSLPAEEDDIEVWRTSARRLLPPDSPLYPFFVWWLFHQFRVFKNQDYQVVFIRDGDRVVQRCCVLPAFFCYPFMYSGDLNVGTWTHPEYRRRGLA